MKYEQLKEKIRYGDHSLVAEMMGCYPDIVRMRFHRKDKETIKALQLVIETRERLIKEYQSKTQ